MKDNAAQFSDPKSAPNQKFEIDIDEMPALQGDDGNQCTISQANENNASIPAANVTSNNQNSPQGEMNKVENMEEDGNGFFITGINTGEQNKQNENAMPEVDVEDHVPYSDPFDKYKHVAVVDCSKAFSNSEVSL